MQRVLSAVLASNNEGKLAEFRALLNDLPIELLSLTQALGVPFEVSEDGVTFRENALLKARAACRATGMLALADDSGLEVDALDGRPGVRSRRFAHERATDAENNAALLRELEHVAESGRAARFRCVLALVSPFSTTERSVEGTCEGHIARTPRGNAGFGYDPLFVVEALGGRAMAELSDAEKNSVSHRGRAVRALRPLLLETLDECLRRTELALG